jgi:predicted membrane protein
MHKNNLPKDNKISTQLSSKGALVYYLGSALFAVGIGLIILGSVLIVFFQIHYGSEPEKILYTILSVATGIILVLIGINLMIKQMKKGYIIVFTSAVFSSIAILLMYINYFNNFYYPLISYIFILYVIGFLVLLGNAFASVIIWIIGNKPDYQIKKEEKSRLYTDEEIQRDIDEATKKSIEYAVNELKIEIEKTTDNIVLGKSFSSKPGNIIRVRDNIGEVLNLKKTLTPSETDKWGSIGIDKVSKQLAKTITHEKKKKNIFMRIKEWFFKKIKKLT